MTFFTHFCIFKMTRENTRLVNWSFPLSLTYDRNRVCFKWTILYTNTQNVYEKQDRYNRYKSLILNLSFFFGGEGDTITFFTYTYWHLWLKHKKRCLEIYLMLKSMFYKKSIPINNLEVASTNLTIIIIK